MSARVLITNGNPMDATARIAALGGRPYGEGYADALRFFEPELDITILDAAIRMAEPGNWLAVKVLPRAAVKA